MKIDRVIKETVLDARRFPLRYDRGADQLHFAWIPADRHHALTFLSDLRPDLSQLRILPRKAVAAVDAPQAPTHLILHSGLAGSTLLARALYQPGAVVTLKEPPIHTDVIAYGLNGATERRHQLNDEVTRLLARRHFPDGTVLMKMNSIGNSLIADIARERASSQVLCLQAPLERVLTSLVSKGSEGRLGGRKLFTGMRNAGLTESIIPASEESRYSDLQLAAAAWLAIQRMMSEAAAEFGSQRVRSITTEQLLNKPRESLEAIATHFDLALDVESRLASGVFSRHSKTGLPFDGVERGEQHAATLSTHEQEIRQTINWARETSDAAGIQWDATSPLLS